MKDYKWRMMIYLGSWFLKIFGRILTYKLFRGNKVVKVIFYIVFFHNRLHFVTFNGFLHTGVLISCRTVIHMKIGGQGFLGFLDYFLGFLCLILVLFDFKELIGSCFIDVLSLK